MNLIHLEELFAVQREIGVRPDGVFGLETDASLGPGIALLHENSCTFYLGRCRGPVTSRTLVTYFRRRILCSRCDKHSVINSHFGIHRPVSEEDLLLLQVMET